MASITIRNLDQLIKARLRVRAAHHQRSMEEEARHILRSVLCEEHGPPVNLAAAIRRRFVSLGAVELSTPPRDAIREPPALTDDRARYQRLGRADQGEVLPRR